MYQCEGYISKAIAENIVRTIESNENVILDSTIVPLYQEGYINCAVNSVIHNENIHFILNAIMKYDRSIDQKLIINIKNINETCELYPRIITKKEYDTLISALVETSFFTRSQRGILFLHHGIRYNDLINILAKTIRYLQLF